jgi:hypothetical protein
MDIEEGKSKKSKAKNSLSHKIGEVVETSSAEFTAQCYKLDQAPPLGGLVKTQDKDHQIYGVVYNVETHGIEPGRRVVIRGENLETEEKIFADNPQLSRLLATYFHVVLVGYFDGQRCHQYLPSKSVSIHSFVYVCQPEDVRAFTQSLDFLSLILNAKIPIPADEVVGACLRNASKTHHDADAFLLKAGKELAGMLSNEVNRLNALLKRVKG